MNKQLRIVLIVSMILGSLLCFYGQLSDRVSFIGVAGLLIYPVGLMILVIASFAIRFKAYSVLICAALTFTFCFISNTLSRPIVDWQVENIKEKATLIAREISIENKKEGVYPSSLTEIKGGDETFFIGPYNSHFSYENQDSTFYLSFPCQGGARQVWNVREQEFNWVE